MAIKLTGDTLTLTYTAIAAKLTTVLTAAAEYLYPSYPVIDDKGEVIPFFSTTNAQRLNIIDKHVKRVLTDAANTQIVNAAQTAARLEAEKADTEL